MVQALVMFNGAPQSYKTTRGNELTAALNHLGLTVERVGATDPFIIPLIRLMEELTGGEVSLPYYWEGDTEQEREAYELAKNLEVAGATGRQLLIDMIDGIRARDILFPTRIMAKKISDSRADIAIVDNVGFEHEFLELQAYAVQSRLFYFSEKRFKRSEAYQHGDQFDKDNRICLNAYADATDPSVSQILDSLGIEH